MSQQRKGPRQVGDPFPGHLPGMVAPFALEGRGGRVVRSALRLAVTATSPAVWGPDVPIPNIDAMVEHGREYGVGR